MLFYIHILIFLTIDINYLVNHLNIKEKTQKNNEKEKKNNKQKSFLAMRRPRENAKTWRKRDQYSNPTSIMD